MKIASDVITADYTDSDESVLDQHYKKLKCKITPLDKKSKDWKVITDYVANTNQGSYQKLTPLDIYCIDRDEETKRYNKKIGNDMLLWHGSGTANYVGILSQGLRIAPPEAPVSGYAFGKGIYFADMVAKSAPYCRVGWGGTNVGCLLLVQVACGKFNELNGPNCNAASLLKGKNTTKGMGRTAPPPKSYIKHNNWTVPIGKPQQYSDYWIGHNEYIVYNVNQAKMRYLIRMKFN
jgi:poly [ADP-ribose] polymerase